MFKESSGSRKATYNEYTKTLQYIAHFNWRKLHVWNFQYAQHFLIIVNSPGYICAYIQDCVQINNLNSKWKKLIAIFTVENHVGD